MKPRCWALVTAVVVLALFLGLTAVETTVITVEPGGATIQDFTIDGQAWNYIENVDEDNYIRAYRDILIYVAEIYDNIIQDYGENGEGIYIGTALAQWGEEKNFSGGEDICLGNIVRDNEITTNGNEGVDVKEGCLDTVIENNNISMQRDENAGGISSHADNTTITGNLIIHAEGAGVRVGTTKADETGHFHGINNTVTGNIMVDCFAYGVKIMSDPQGDVCGNYVELRAEDTEDTLGLQPEQARKAHPTLQWACEYKYAGGTYGAGYKPFEACNATLGVTSAPTPAPSNTPERSAKGSPEQPTPNSESCYPLPLTLARRVNMHVGPIYGT
eukprot:jgi/Undpi1/6585/HiC_scaffold_20.g09064.m1